MKQRIAIIGSIKFSNYLKFKKVMETIIKLPDIEFIITRGLPGVENMASMYAEEYDIYNRIHKISSINDDQMFYKDSLVVKDADRIILFNDGDIDVFKNIIKLAEQKGTKIENIQLIEQKGTGQKTISKNTYKK